MDEISNKNRRVVLGCEIIGGIEIKSSKKIRDALKIIKKELSVELGDLLFFSKQLDEVDFLVLEIIKFGCESFFSEERETLSSKVK